MANSAASVANSFLLEGFKDRAPISPMMIQKLLYLAQGYHLYKCREPIFDEQFEAWRFGPVVPSIYKECKKYVRSDITKLITAWDANWGEQVPVASPSESDAIEVIDFVWRTYGHYDPIVLSQWTHESDGPWDRVTRSGSRIKRHALIPNELIQEYFEHALGNRSGSNAI